MEPLREEIDAVLTDGDWSTESLDKLWKVDSFLKECGRVDGVGMSKPAPSPVI